MRRPVDGQCRLAAQAARATQTAVVVAIMAIVVLVPTIAMAQLSPGPLSSAHEHLEGVKNCLKCHGLGENSVDRHCLGCHDEIQWLRDQKRGLHGRVGGAAASGECVDCHGEHSGRDFAIVHWGGGDFTSFNHRDAGWTLDGRHAETKCRGCHRSELHTTRFPGNNSGPGNNSRPSTHSWLGLETDCVACHRDPHEARMGDRCADCHGTGDFHTILEDRFDHEVTRYPLRGAHSDVKCAGCHDRRDGKMILPAFDRCNSCHQDPHAGQADVASGPQDCDVCHTVRYFRPSTLDRRFHADTRFPLDDQHAKVDCAKCHRGDPARFGTAAFEFKPPTRGCSDCHNDAHGTQLAAARDGGACESCHVGNHFRPSTFTIADHDHTKFPLVMAHTDVKCRACHGPDRKGLPPLPGLPTLGTAGILLHPESAECDACHADPHHGRFSAGGEEPVRGGCTTCHTQQTFGRVQVTATLHRDLGFELDGAHAAIACFECHRELQGERLRSTLLLSASSSVHLPFSAETACGKCHEDPHAGQFAERSAGGTCDTCHDTASFRSARRFQHDRDSSFRLAGAHARVACSGCHAQIQPKRGAAFVQYLPTATRCEDCHAPGTTPTEGQS